MRHARHGRGQGKARGNPKKQGHESLPVQKIVGGPGYWYIAFMFYCVYSATMKNWIEAMKIMWLFDVWQQDHLRHLKSAKDFSQLICAVDVTVRGKEQEK